MCGPCTQLDYWIAKPLNWETGFGGSNPPLSALNSIARHLRLSSAFVPLKLCRGERPRWTLNPAESGITGIRSMNKMSRSDGEVGAPPSS
jgi:hypothetical protein